MQCRVFEQVAPDKQDLLQTNKKFDPYQVLSSIYTVTIFL